MNSHFLLEGSATAKRTKVSFLKSSADSFYRTSPLTTKKQYNHPVFNIDYLDFIIKNTIAEVCFITKLPGERIKNFMFVMPKFFSC